jgi:hypothetical protein
MLKLDIPLPPARESALRQDFKQAAPGRSTTAGRTRTTHRVLRFLLALVLCLTILAVFIPLNPLMPVPGLDMSWMMAMNQAVAQHLVFGKDIVFTFGPYASIYTKLYHPATDRMMVWGSLFLGVSYFALLLLLGEGQKVYGTLLYGVFLAALLTSRDALLLSYPLMVALVVYRLTLPDDHGIKLNLAKPLEIACALVLAPLGLLPLIKESLLPICVGTAILCCGLLWRAGQRIPALAAIVVPAFSCVLLWAVAGQPVVGLPRFYLSAQQIISGYTEAMASGGDPLEWLLYVLASTTILLVVVWTARRPGSSGWFLAACYALFLFTAFKAGFVRHDEWHDVTAGSSILAAALLLMFVIGERRSLLPLMMAALAWAYINHGSEKAVADDVSLNSRMTFQGALLGARTRLQGPGQLEREYNERIAAIHREFPIDRMPGTTDIYSDNQSWLLASENTWAPRPVVQSYSAYTPDLAALNLRHLEDGSAPDNILFKVEPIDGRLPSLEDGLSWLALINRYVAQKLDGQAAYFRKRTTGQKPLEASEPDFYSARQEFGEEVPLPESNDPVFARMEINPTFFGRILSFLLKPPQLYISVRLRDGRTRTYRALSNVMKSDFLITPLVNSTEEFALLAAGGTKYLAANQVKSIAMSSDDRHGWFWNPAYSLSLRKIELQRNTEAENSLLFDRINDAKPASLSPPSALKCEGSIENVNGGPPSHGTATVDGAVFLNGWTAIAAKDGIVPDYVVVSLTSETGRTLYVRAHSTPRNDVKQHFNQPGMPDPGYAAMIDVSGLKGRYTLGLARMYQGTLGACQQFKLSLLINP